MGEKNWSLKNLSYVFAATAGLLFIAAIIMAMGGGFMDSNRFVTIVILCSAFAFSVLGAILSLVNKQKSNKN